mgnify:CR=1 FL=1
MSFAHLSLGQLFALDVIAVAVLVFAIYVPRHRRRDLVFALVGINIGVLAVTQALSSADVGAGLGLGLFGVLSIIRLRSTELDQAEVGYYFSAIALGLLGGVHVNPGWLNPVLMAAIVLAAAVADHPRLYGAHRQQTLLLDQAYPDETSVLARAEQFLGTEVSRVVVRRVDLVQDTTLVDVRYRIPSRRDAGAHPAGDHAGANLVSSGWGR